MTRLDSACFSQVGIRSQKWHGSTCKIRPVPVDRGRHELGRVVALHAQHLAVHRVHRLHQARHVLQRLLRRAAAVDVHPVPVLEPVLHQQRPQLRHLRPRAACIWARLPQQLKQRPCAVGMTQLPNPIAQERAYANHLDSSVVTSRSRRRSIYLAESTGSGGRLAANRDAIRAVGSAPDPELKPCAHRGLVRVAQRLDLPDRRLRLVGARQLHHAARACLHVCRLCRLHTCRLGLMTRTEASVSNMHSCRNPVLHTEGCVQPCNKTSRRSG